MNKLINILIALLLVIYPWGAYFDNFLPSFITGEGRGLSTIISIIIIILGVLSNNLLKGIYKLSNYFSFTIFITLSFFGTMLSDQPDNAVTSTISFITYFSLIFIIVGFNPDKKKIRDFILCLVGSTSLMALLSLVDYIGVFPIPNFNQANSLILSEDSWVKDLTGPFQIRTHMAIHLSLIIFLPILYFDKSSKSIFRKTFWLILFILILTVSFLTHSRTILLAGFFGFIYYLLYIKTRFKVSYLMLFLVLGVFSYTVFEKNNNLFTTAIKSRLDVSNSSETSDWLRYYAFEATLEDVLKSPIGAGFSKPYIDQVNAHKDVHSSITFVLRSGGFVGFFALLYFFYPVFKKIISRDISEDDIFIFLPIICLFFFGFFHTAIQVTTFWVLMGFAFNSIYNDKNEELSLKRKISLSKI